MGWQHGAVADQQHYDMVVIGAGPAGEKAAAQAAYHGHSVAIVDSSRRPGGAMAGGAVPTKTMREAALYLTGFRQREAYGISLDLTPATAVARMQSRTDHVVHLTAESVAANLERHHIELIHGWARLAGGRAVSVAGEDGSSRTLDADVILIATGSSPFRPPGIPFDDPDVLDSDEATKLDGSVRDLVVVGGGAVGCEYASIFTALGVDVTLVDSGSRLLPFVDAEVSGVLADVFRAAGMRIVSEAGHATAGRDDKGIWVKVASGEVLRPGKVVFAAGRTGNTSGLGLDDAGVETDARGRIIVNEQYRTTAEGIYAAGDVIGPPALASVSMEQARVAACYAFDIPFKRSVDELPPFGVYSIPEVAMVGLTEEAARAQGIDCEAGTARFESNTRAAISGSADGILKLVFRRDDRRLLGVHILCDGATELIHQGQAVLHFDGTIEYFIHSTFNVPTLSEAYKYAAYNGLSRVGL
jgi:NAD(P) transhydrogenase